MSRALSRKKSESKNVQREHSRMLMTRQGMREIMINIGVKKTPLFIRPTGLRRIHVKPIAIRPVGHLPVLKIKPIKERKQERVILSFESFKERLLKNKEFQSLFAWLNKNLDELYNYLFDDWQNWAGNNKVTEKNFDKQMNDFVLDSIDLPDVAYDMRDKARVSFMGDFSKVKDPILRKILRLSASPQEEYSYFYDPWDQKLIVDDESGMGSGFNKKHWYVAMTFGEPFFVEDFGRGDYANEPDQSDSAAGKFLDSLEDNDVPYVFVSGINDAAIVVPKEYRDKALRLRRKLSK